NFAQVSNPYLPILNPASNQHLIPYHLAQHFSIQTPIILPQLYPHPPHSKFSPLPSPYQPPLPPIPTHFPLHIP
ncbi:TerD family protein, partial [Bacillus altitudinis]|uniref:TerD family protein n=1 Tax=Bacillus altitudinis TaxID=293387 RepID=UPI0011A4D20D